MNPSIIDINEQNLTETLQLSQQIPLVLTFYAPSHETSQNFTALLERITEQHQGNLFWQK